MDCIAYGAALADHGSPCVMSESALHRGSRMGAPKGRVSDSICFHITVMMLKKLSETPAAPAAHSRPAPTRSATRMSEALHARER